MLGGIRRRLTFANVMSTIAVFCALGGGAYAAVTLPKNSVGTKQLKKNAVVNGKLGKNAVTNAKLGNNAVTGAKVKDGSLTGADINLATLPKVGTAAISDNAAHATNADNATNATNAGHATTADTATALAPHEPIHLVGAPGEPAFATNARNYPDNAGPPAVKYRDAGFYKDKEGNVHLQGIAVTGDNGFIFNLPPGYRPAQGSLVAFSVFCNNCTDTVAGGGGGTYTQWSIPMLVLGAGIAPYPDGLVIAEGVPGTVVSLDGVEFSPEA
ncbi:MAG TPA: hypothetical protein VE570_12830 [Thermoleophilaceae bacterium]|nr:hypothetical protein [Thermoleophilaceae bacterium]